MPTKILVDNDAAKTDWEAGWQSASGTGFTPTYNVCDGRERGRTDRCFWGFCKVFYFDGGGGQ